jgi:hypothetical protein
MAREPSKALRDGGFFEFKKKASKGMCWVKHCTNEQRGDRSICSKHNMQHWRSKKKGSSAFHALRNHAKARKVEFTITRDYFQGLVDAFGMFDNPDPTDVPTIDRVRAHEGYIPGNLRVISKSLNAAKGNRERRLPEHIQDMLRREREKIQSDNAEHLRESVDDMPF